MPTLFSDHFNSDGTVGPGEGALTEELGLDTQRRANPGTGHSRYRCKRAKILVGTVAGTSDQIRMMTFHSSDRISSVLLSLNGGATAADADLGWYLTGDNHDGALASTASVDAFSTTALIIDTALTKDEKFTDGDYDGGDVGKQVWELINVSDAATYAVDPILNFDLTFTVTVAFTATVVGIVLEVLYMSD